jgi:hypothetical protein
MDHSGHTTATATSDCNHGRGGERIDGPEECLERDRLRASWKAQSELFQGWPSRWDIGDRCHLEVVSDALTEPRLLVAKAVGIESICPSAAL